MIEAIDRLHVDAALFAAVIEIERHRRAGGADSPDLAVEIGAPAQWLSRDTHDLVALADAGLLTVTSRRDARHDRAPVHIVGRIATPWNAGPGHATTGDPIADGR